MAQHTLTIWMTAALLAGTTAALTGCRGDREDKPPREFFPDMDQSPKFKPQTATEFFADGRAMRPAVEGTVPFGRWDFDIDNTAEPWAQSFKTERADLLKEDEAFYRGTAGTSPDGKPVYIKSIPIAVNAELIARGKDRYNIYCVVCHGYTGAGDGMVGQKWTGQIVANFHNAKYLDPKEPDQKSADGYLFHTAMVGVVNPAVGTQTMPGYSHALSERDAWAIVAYIRTLQETAPLSEVPEARRKQLEEERAKLPPVAPTGATGATGAPAPTGPAAPGGKP